MGRVEAILAVSLAVSMAGCALTGKPKTAPAAPPQPQPAAQPKPAPAPEPLSVPQTRVQLPPPQQPVNPDALTAVKPPEPVEPAAAPKPARRTGGGPPQPKPEAVAPPVVPAEPERPPIEAIVPADERRRYQESADFRKREIRQLLEQAKAQRLTSEQGKVVKRINSFMTQSDDAEKRGDMRQADALAERGLVLARELADGK